LGAFFPEAMSIMGRSCLHLIGLVVFGFASDHNSGKDRFVNSTTLSNLNVSINSSKLLDVSAGDWGLTKVALDLNEALKQSDTWTKDLKDMKYSDVYTGGKGAFFFAYFDGFEPGGDHQHWDTLLPSRVGTFWHNDIFAPSQAYPSGAPWEDDSFSNAVVGPVIYGRGMEKMFKSFHGIQRTDWDHGVFYAHDANVDDKRCHYIEEHKAYDCPLFWVEDGKPISNSEKMGAGRYQGQGCHFNTAKQFIDQTDAYGPDGSNLVQDYNCQCNYDSFRDGTANSWSGWVDQWVHYATQKQEANPDEYWWFAKGLAPQWGADYAACWVNNPRDMSLLQNHFYWKRADWLSSNSGPNIDVNDNKDKHYWGWNEVPVEASVPNNVRLWDAIAIKLPAGMPSPSGLGGTAVADLEAQLGNYLDHDMMKAGKQYLGRQPGSGVIFVKEYQDDSGNWQKYAFCEDWEGPKYKIVYRPKSLPLHPHGACYLEKK
jgi:hypothetical protein